MNSPSKQGTRESAWRNHAYRAHPFVLTAGTMVPLRGQTRSCRRAAPAIAHNSRSKQAAMPKRSSSWAICDAASVVVKRWSAKSPMPTAKASAGAAVDNKIIYIYAISILRDQWRRWDQSALSKTTIPLPRTGAKRFTDSRHGGTLSWTARNQNCGRRPIQRLGKLQRQRQ